MKQKNPLKKFAVGALLLVLLLVISQLWGTPIKDILVGIFVSALYAFLILAYGMRIAFVFVGVFAIFRMFQKRYTKQLAA